MIVVENACPDIHIFKENILLRTSKDPNYTVDWAEFASRDRAELQKAHVDVQAKLEKVTYACSNVTQLNQMNTF